MPKTVILVSTYDTTCGIATYTRDLALCLQTQGVSVFIAAEVKKTDISPRFEEIEGIPVYRIWRRGAAYDSQLGLSAIAKLVKNSKVPPDAIHIQHEFGIFPDNAAFLKLLTEFRQLNTIITLHTVTAPPSNLGFFNPFISNFRNIKLISHTPAAQVILNKRCNRSTYSISHGVPFPGNSKRDLGFYINFVCTGFISPSKGHPDIIKAFSEVWEESYRLHIVGLCRDPSYLDKLNNQIRSLSLEEFILINEGFKTKEEIDGYLNSADVIVLGGGKTSPYSASGQLAQALGANLPIIAKNLPIYRSQTSSNILYYNSYEECAFFMKALLDEDTRKMVSNHTGFLTYPQVAKKHLEIYFGTC